MVSPKSNTKISKDEIEDKIKGLIKKKRAQKLRLQKKELK